MVDDGDGRSERSSGRVSPLPPIPTLSDLIVDSQPEPGSSESQQELAPPNINTLYISPSSFSPSNPGNASPLTPVSPGHDQKLPKRPNPLIDLIDTEKNYVDLLGGIIRVSFFLYISSWLVYLIVLQTESCLCMVKEQLTTKGIRFCIPCGGGNI